MSLTFYVCIFLMLFLDVMVFDVVVVWWLLVGVQGSGYQPRQQQMWTAEDLH